MKPTIKSAVRPLYRAVVRSPGLRQIIAREVDTAAQGVAATQRRLEKSRDTASRWDMSAVTMPAQAEKLLKSMYACEPQLGTDGQLHQLDGGTKIAREEGLFLKELHQSIRPELSIEIGFAYGFSTVYLLSAMMEGNYGRHIAMDPFETEAWHGIGVQKVKELQMEDRFTFMEQDSALALPKLAAEGRKAQFIFIDGCHKFDDVLTDFYLADKICDVGGRIIFDDLWMPSIQKVLAFVDSNRPDYEPCPCPDRNAAVYKKLRKDDRDWQHYVAF